MGISGLVTFIAAYHYIRIFNSWVDAYHYSDDAYLADPLLTGVPFNDAYRYMDWLLTVPLLLIEILLVMKLDDAEFSGKAWTLGLGSALMIVSGYYGELVVTGDLTPRWLCWFLSMMFFLYIVYELLVGLAAATNNESDPIVKSKIQSAQLMTVISWCTYPVVYLIPMLVPDSAAKAVVGIQIGYCASDIISNMRSPASEVCCRDWRRPIVETFSSEASAPRADRLQFLFWVCRFGIQHSFFFVSSAVTSAHGVFRSKD